MNSMGIFWDTITNLIEIIVVYVLPILCLKMKYKRSKSLLMIICLLLSSVAVTMISVKYSGSYAYIFVILGISILSKLLFQERFIKILYYFSLTYYFIYFSDFFASTLLSLIFSLNVETVIDMHNIYGTLFYIFTKLITILLIYFYQKLFKKINFSLNSSYLIIMNIIILLGIKIIDLVMDIVFSTAGNHVDSVTIPKMLLTGILISIILGLIIYLFSQLSLYYQNKELKLENELTERLLKNKIKNQQDKELELRRMRHDFKENIASINYMIKNEKIKEAMVYMNNLTDEINKLKAKIMTGNVYIDAALNNNLEICEQKNIKLVQNVDIITDFKVQPLILSNILTNILKNSVAATEKLNKEDRLIAIKIFEYKNYVIIEVENTHREINLEQKINIKKGILFNYVRQGMGIGIIKKNVESLNGQYKIRSDARYFRTIVLLPKPN